MATVVMVRKLSSATAGTYSRILRDTDTDECVVKFYRESKHLPEADYFTDDYLDAIDTACVETARMGGIPDCQD